MDQQPARSPDHNPDLTTRPTKSVQPFPRKIVVTKNIRVIEIVRGGPAPTPPPSQFRELAPPGRGRGCGGFERLGPAGEKKVLEVHPHPEDRVD